jgi:Zn-dependent peptidase ImmA (M78 family)
MTLEKYPCRPSGIYILSKKDIEEIATDFLSENYPHVLREPQTVDIDHLAVERMYLDIEYKDLTYDRSVLGLITFENGMIPYINEILRSDIIFIEEGTIVIDVSLREKSQQKRRRFTVGHECSHWLLHRTFYSPINQTYTMRKERNESYIACRGIDIESAKRYDNSDVAWSEWQANGLAAALLMPAEPFRQVATDSLKRHFGEQRRNVSPFSVGIVPVIGDIAKVFNVSNTAIELRMKQLQIL